MAQAGNPYNGNWKATWEGTQGMQHRVNQAKVVILDNGGSFQNQHKSKANPCVGQKAPIAVKSATEGELIFVIQFSSVLKGCIDSEVSLKRVDDKTLKGLRDKDKPITLVRD